MKSKRSFQKPMAIVLFFLTIGSGYAQSIVINEFMASNAGAVQSNDGQYPDWIELYNPSDQTVSLAGLYLSDKLDNLTKWRFPDDRPDLTTLDPNGYRVVWASGSPSTPAELHASFSLNADGEALVLTDTDGQTIVDVITFDKQISDTSFGRDANAPERWVFLFEPTPGQTNSAGVLGWVEPVQFSVERGFYDTPFTVTLSCPTPEVEIWYTTDAIVPHSPYAVGRDPSQVYGEIYTGPIAIAQTTCLRAVAVKEDWQEAAVITHSYLFTSDSIEQSNRPQGFPTS